MKCYASPYEGNQDYIFFSYCHDDGSAVYPIIERLSIEGFRVWYDDGIHPGDNWPEVIASHLSKAKVCIAALSKASAESHNCRNEVSFAVANNKQFVSIVIEDFPMPLGMQLQLSSSNYIKITDFSTDEFYQHLLAAPTIAGCRKDGESASSKDLREWQKHIQEFAHGLIINSEEESKRFVIDPVWFEERKRLEAEIAALKREQEEARNRLQQEKERLLAEKERQCLEEERLQQERLAREAEAKRLAEEEARRKAEQERLAREEKARRRAEEENRHRAEQERLAREAEAKRLAEEEARRRAEQERLARVARAKRRAEEENRRRAEQERLSKENGADGKVDLKKDEIRGKSGESPASDADCAILIRMRTGEIFTIGKDRVRIGRDKDSDIVFSGNMAISHSHLEIVNDSQTYTLKNISSSAAEVAGTILQPGCDAPLGEYAEIIISDELCFFVSGNAYRRIFEERKLRMLRCKESGETRLLVDDVLPLDRYHKWKQNILGDERISRGHHAELVRKGPQTMLRDVGSLHGTFLNSKRINTGEEAALQNGDTIAIVETEFVYYESNIG